MAVGSGPCIRSQTLGWAGLDALVEDGDVFRLKTPQSVAEIVDGLVEAGGLEGACDFGFEECEGGIRRKERSVFLKPFQGLVWFDFGKGADAGENVSLLLEGCGGVQAWPVRGQAVGT